MFSRLKLMGLVFVGLFLVNNNAKPDAINGEVSIKFGIDLSNPEKPVAHILNGVNEIVSGSVLATVPLIFMVDPRDPSKLIKIVNPEIAGAVSKNIDPENSVKVPMDSGYSDGNGKRYFSLKNGAVWVRDGVWSAVKGIGFFSFGTLKLAAGTIVIISVVGKNVFIETCHAVSWTHDMIMNYYRDEQQRKKLSAYEEESNEEANRDLALLYY
jgi:hypothetical protein